ncbi:hypothetical protein [Gloeocapsopsis dulcis]|uniref:Uncharacterized protein n=1 Tax=Gloeocapsopsis dulcis AAB1 = 1H9 TaxID=1433147 RepID=A0A6N8FXX4_9CHRO|nr:hypothetical protein [Gloeocapsopsis dulcis]MUL37175.1 hypothetical protein [Gloeocapsopsis dulcis AAB1 = 1H9]WNN90218.1 hypothetical protein P0S91_03715 [Gloeocapsopsis dulcis]
MASKSKIRVAATGTIWGFATGMLAICIPLTTISNSGIILPLAVISSAVVGTWAVWQSPDNKSSNNLVNTIKNLEQRVADLETISSSHESDLQRKIRRLDTED